MGHEITITLRPEKIQFSSNCIKIVNGGLGRYTIPYSGIIWACVSVYDSQSGTYYEPEITEITKETEGVLHFYDSTHCKWCLQTELTGQTAGSMIEELAMHAPYILIGRSMWFNLEIEEDFDQLAGMTGLMREC